MEKLSSLNLSFDKVLIQLIIPGLIAIFPWFLVYINLPEHKNAKHYFYQNSTVTLTTLTFLALIAGLLLENFSSRLEVSYFDAINSNDDKDYDLIWRKFLQLSFKEEPIGLRYLRNILMRMKFELSTGLAMFPMVAGLFVLNDLKPIFLHLWQYMLFLWALPMALFIYLFFVEVMSSSKVLAGTRKLLVTKYWARL